MERRRAGRAPLFGRRFFLQFNSPQDVAVSRLDRGTTSFGKTQHLAFRRHFGRQQVTFSGCAVRAILLDL